MREAGPEDGEGHCGGQFTEFLASEIAGDTVRSQSGAYPGAMGVDTEHLQQGEGHLKVLFQKDHVIKGINLHHLENYSVGLTFSIWFL